MNKKVLCLIMVCVFLLSGCGKDKPKYMPEEVYDQGVRVVKAIDKYYAGEMTLDMVGRICDEAEAVVSNFDTQNLSVLESSDVAIMGTELSRVSLIITNMKYDSMFGEDSSQEFKSVYEDLKEMLNM